MRGRELQLLVGIVAVAALARFATLDEQSYWLDEAVTVGLVRMDFGGMLEEIPDSESTPPLYYVVAWLWAKVFGTGEVGLRSLSALCGTALVPVMYAIGARAASIRVGLLAAALAALNPLLIWYSQEARAYAFLTLLAALSFYLFVRLLTGDVRRRTLVLWAVVSAVALATHYFAAFLVAIEAVWLLTTAANRRPVAVAVASLAAVELAHLPLLLRQRSLNLADFIDEIPLGYRLARTPKQFLVGFDAPGEVLSAIAAGVLILLAVWLVRTRGDERERRIAVVGFGVGGTLLVATALLAVVGVDYFDTRNVLPAWPPLAVAVAAGFGARRSGTTGIAAAIALALVSASTAVLVATSQSLQRDDWRGVAEALGEPHATPRAVVATPFTAARVFAVYRPALDPMPAEGVPVREVDLIALPLRRRTQARPGSPPRPEGYDPPQLEGFSLVEQRFEETYTLLRYISETPESVSPRALQAAHIESERRSVVLLDG